MLEKQQPIVAQNHPQRPKNIRPSRSSLVLALKKDDLELNLYSSMDLELMNKILSKVLS